jgi:hypothetical protein
MRRLLLIVALLAACATVQTHGSAPFRVECNVQDAFVLIDDVLIGNVNDWAKPGRAIRPGFHRIEIRHPSYHSYFTEIEPRDGESVVIKAELHPQLD